MPFVAGADVRLVGGGADGLGDGAADDSKTGRTSDPGLEIPGRESIFCKPVISMDDFL